MVRVCCFVPAATPHPLAQPLLIAVHRRRPRVLPDDHLRPRRVERLQALHGLELEDKELVYEGHEHARPGVEGEDAVGLEVGVGV